MPNQSLHEQDDAPPLVPHSDAPKHRWPYSELPPRTSEDSPVRDHAAADAAEAEATQSRDEAILDVEQSTARPRQAPVCVGELVPDRRSLRRPYHNTFRSPLMDRTLALPS